MTLMEFVGCALIGFGPALSMFAITIARDPIRIIILITAAFFWLLSLLLSSIVWFAVVPLRKQLAFGVVCSVIFQEAGRFLFYRLLRMYGGAKKGKMELRYACLFATVLCVGNYILGEWRRCLTGRLRVSGLGFGVMSGIFSLLNVLADAVGPGTVGLNGGSSSFFLTSALTTSAFVLLHTFWGVVSFHALDHGRWPLVAFVVVTHLVASCLTLLNPSGLHIASLVPIYVLLLVSAVLAFHAAGGRLHALLRFKGLSLPQQQPQQPEPSPH